jgi:hypothetical protein
MVPVPLAFYARVKGRGALSTLEETMADSFTCDRCDNQFPREKLKEVMYEEGRERVRKELCPNCLDQVMNQASGVRGIAGHAKKAAVHLSGTAGVDGENAGERGSFGTRG